MHEPHVQHTKIAEKRVSRLDLFFDLIYVLLIRDLFYVLTDTLSYSTLTQIFLFFTPVWLIRHGYNFYVQRYDDTSVGHRFLAFLLMLIIGIYSFSIHKFGLIETQSIIYTSVISHVMLACMFIVPAIRNTKKGSVRVLFYVGALHILFAIPWLFGLNENYWYLLDILLPIAIWVFIGGMFLIPFLFPNRPQVNTEFISERFGLFIIIVLAELIYGLITGLGEAPFMSMANIRITILGFITCIAIRRTYFHIIGHNPIKHTRRNKITRWTLLHLPLSLGIIALGSVFLYNILQTSSSLEDMTLIRILAILYMAIMTNIGVLSLFHSFLKAKRSYSRYLGYVPLIAILLESIVIISRTFSITNLSASTLLIVLILLSALNITLFHIYIDPFDKSNRFL